MSEGRFGVGSRTGLRQEDLESVRLPAANGLLRPPPSDSP